MAAAMSAKPALPMHGDAATSAATGDAATDYACPMHPDLRKLGPGRCPKCGMAMRAGIPKPAPGGAPAPTEAVEAVGWKSYLPLIVVLSLLLAACIALAIKDLHTGIRATSLEKFVTRFMAGFFLAFAGFKLMDLPGFVEGYTTYDLLAMRWRPYAWLYPFIELAFGLLMLASLGGAILLWAELAVMAFSGVGVAIKLAKREPFHCACLGTFLKVPLTAVTLVEDFGMAALAGLLLLLPLLR
jgi:hypothetical protein